MSPTLVRFGRWAVRAEPEKTRSAYADRVSATSRCGCNICKNYEAVRDAIFTAEARDLLKDLGVDYRRETEMVHSHRIARGRHAYDGWFHLFGTIESGRDAYAARGELFARELEPLTDALSFGFTSRVRGAAPPF